MRAFLLGVLLVVFSAQPTAGQILDRLRNRAEAALDETSLLSRLLEEPPGITTNIQDAQTEIPFLDGHDPGGTALMAMLPRDVENAFFAPPGLYELQAESYCIQAGTYGPTDGDGYALAPLRGELAPILRTLMRASVDHPEIAQVDIQSLIWALQARASLEELSPDIRDVARVLLEADQIERLSEGVVDLAKEAFMTEALERVPESVRRAAEIQADLRELLRQGASFEELEAVAVLVGSPSLDDLVRDVPGLRWNYHSDGYFIRFDPVDYTLTHVQAYVPEVYRLIRDASERVQALVGPRGLRITFDYGAEIPGARGTMAALVGVGFHPPAGMGGDGLAKDGAWTLDAWSFVGNDMGGEEPTGVVPATEWQSRREEARTVRRQARDLITSVRGRDSGRPSEDLADLGHLRMALLKVEGQVPPEVLIHLANAWQYTLCLEAGGCSGQRMAAAFPFADASLFTLAQEWGLGGGSGPLSMPKPIVPAIRAGGGTSVDAGGNVATPGNNGSQRLLQSGKTPVEKANLAMKALSIFLALADVLGSSGLGSAAYNALGIAGLPVGHLGLPTMMAGAMISEVVGMWSDATDALAGETGGDGSGGDDGGGSSEGGDEGSGTGDTGGVPGDDPMDPRIDPDLGEFPGVGGWEDTRSDGQDYENTPPPNPPAPPSPPPSPGGGGGMSPARTDSYQAFSDALMGTLYHTQGMADSQLRHDAACQAGETGWAQTQAGLAGDHQRKAAEGLLEVARSLESLLSQAESEGALGSDWAYAEDLARVQERLATEGWSDTEMQVAGQLRITPAEMAALSDYLISQDAETMAGELGESVRLWAKQMRTAGLLWMALPPPGGGCG